MEAAIFELRRYKPGHLVMAVPVAPADTAARLGRLVDEFIAVDAPVDYLGAVGAYYADFEQVSDAEVIALLDEVNRPVGKGPR
jgi:predicted phosphoribosyltransferase